MSALPRGAQPLRVLVVDDSRVAREMVAAVPGQMGGFEGVAVAGRGLQRLVTEAIGRRCRDLGADAAFPKSQRDALKSYQQPRT